MKSKSALTGIVVGTRNPPHLAHLLPGWAELMNARHVSDVMAVRLAPWVRAESEGVV